MNDSDLMVVLMAYGVVGLVTAVLVIGYHLFEPKPKGELYKALVSNEHLTLWPWVLKHVLKPLLGFVILTFVWPLAWFVGFMAVWEDWRRKAKDKRAEFVVKRKYLKSPCQLSLVEQSNLVDDPLGAVPALPFGHLNAVWSDFVLKRPDAAELWSFACVWENRYGRKDQRQGYAWLLNREITDWVVLDIKPFSPEE
mgnify:FL=1